MELPENMRLAHADAPLLRLRGVTVGFEARTVLADVDLDIPQRGLTAVMGPGGVGKTTLLRTLGRWSESLPSFWLRGEASLGDRDLMRDVSLAEAQRAFPLLAQKARLYTADVLENAIAEVRDDTPLTRLQKREIARGVLEAAGLWREFEPLLDAPVLSLSIGRQRLLSVARLVARHPRCLLADEPLRDLSPDEATEMEALLSRVCGSLAVVMVTHNLNEARRISDRVCLIAAGRVIEVTPSEEFFAAPRTELGRRFLASGSCWPADSTPAAAAPAPIEQGSVARPAAGWPGGFHWILRDRLGGMQWPGLVREETDDLRALAALRVDVVVSLTESAFDARRLQAVGVRGEHFPIADMGVPRLEDAEDLCLRISRWIDDGRSVVLHCKAGLGRTGTVLACVLVQRGSEPVAAIHRVRSTNPLYIQSDQQLEFVTEFATHLKAKSRDPER